MPTDRPTVSESERTLVEQLEEAAKFLHCCRGTEPAEFYDEHTATVRAAAARIRELEERERREVKLGVIEFHSPSLNPGLIDRFYAAVKDLRDAACIVDLWLMDIASVLGEHGYEMRVLRTAEKQAAHEAAAAERVARRSALLAHTESEDRNG